MAATQRGVSLGVSFFGFPELVDKKGHPAEEVSFVLKTNQNFRGARFTSQRTSLNEPSTPPSPKAVGLASLHLTLLWQRGLGVGGGGRGRVSTS